jgi:hypothetical protein
MIFDSPHGAFAVFGVAFVIDGKWHSSSMENSLRSLLVSKFRATENFRVALAATVVRRPEVGVAICGRPPGEP